MDENTQRAWAATHGLTGDMDVVYVVRPGDENEALRYSLRSLVNFPHRQVWISGHLPPWVDGVGHIPGDVGATKEAKIYHAVLAAAKHPGMSERFVLFNDDFYVTEPMTALPPAVTGDSLRGKAVDPDIADVNWQRSLRTTVALLQSMGIVEPDDYELHVPLVVDRARLVEILEPHAGDQPPQVRSLYGNLAGIGGAPLADPKQYLSADGVTVTRPLMSSAPITFPRLQGKLAEMFPDLSPYENAADPRLVAPPDAAEVAAREHQTRKLMIEYLKYRAGVAAPGGGTPHAAATVPRPATPDAALLREWAVTYRLDGDMDVVYVVRPGDENEALRYSLRSLVNFPHRRVWISGHRPPWVDGVGHIPGDVGATKEAKIYHAVLAAAQHPGVSERFVLFNDDFFVTKPVSTLPPIVNVESLRQQAREPGIIDEGRRRSMLITVETLAVLGLPEPLNYELHMPMVIDKNRLVELVAPYASDHPPQLRSMYGNLAGLSGAPSADVEVPAWGEDATLPMPLFSTSPISFPRFQVLLAERFADRSPYENADAPRGAVPPDRKPQGEKPRLTALATITGLQQRGRR